VMARQTVVGDRAWLTVPGGCWLAASSRVTPVATADTTTPNTHPTLRLQTQHHPTVTWPDLRIVAGLTRANRPRNTWGWVGACVCLQGEGGGLWFSGSNYKTAKTKDSPVASVARLHGICPERRQRGRRRGRRRRRRGRRWRGRRRRGRRRRGVALAVESGDGAHSAHTRGQDMKAVVRRCSGLQVVVPVHGNAERKAEERCVCVYV
jgi:hypothetical protein